MLGANRKSVTRVMGWTMSHLMSGERTVSTTASAKQILTMMEMGVQSVEKQCPFRSTAQALTERLVRHEPTIPTADLANTKIKPFHEVPGPKGLPFVGTIFDYFKKDGLKFSKMFEAYRQRALQFGPLYKEQIGPIQTIVISDPSEYSKVLRVEGRAPIRREMEPMVHYRKQKGIQLGIVNSQGEEWHRYRTAVSKHMLKLPAIGQFSKPVDAVCEDFVERLSRIKDNKGEVNALQTEIFKWAMESIGTFLFEERIGCLEDNPTPQAQDFISNLKSYFHLMQPLMYNLPIYKIFRTKLWKQFEFHADEVMRIGRLFVDKKIAALEKENQENTSAFLSDLIANENLSAEDVTGTAVDLMMAAVETTSNALMWTLYCLAKNPDAQEKCLQEVKDILPDGGEISQESLSQLPYIKSVLKETLRIYPITYATSRILQGDVEINGYNVPAGSHVQANLYGMFRDPALFPEPESFQPDRWLRGKMDPKLKFLSNLIWGHGPRMCIGRRFAEMEIHIILAKLVQKFKMSYESEDVEPTLNTVMTPDRPVRIIFTSRK